MPDFSQYLPRLSDNIRAQLEPVSGLLVVDVDTATYGEAFVNWALGTPKEKDLELILAINHETYHYFQTIATGYQYQYVSEMWRTVSHAYQERSAEDIALNEADEEIDILRMRDGFGSHVERRAVHGTELPGRRSSIVAGASISRRPVSASDAALGSRRLTHAARSSKSE